MNKEPKERHIHVQTKVGGKELLYEFRIPEDPKDLYGFMEDVAYAIEDEVRQYIAGTK